MPVILNNKVAPQGLSSTGRFGDQSAGSFILVVPTKRRIRHLTRDILQIERTALPEAPIYTLELLAVKICQAAFEDLRVIDLPIQTLLFNNAVRMQRNIFQYFNVRGRDAQLPRGTFEKVIDVVLKLKEVGVYPETLAEELHTVDEDERAKLEDVAAIYNAYEDGLKSIDGIDAGGIFKALYQECSQEWFEQTFRRLFPRVVAISIVGFDEFTEPEIGFLKKLCDTKGISISLVFDFLPGNSPLFGHLEENYRRFQGLGFIELPAHHQKRNHLDILLRSEDPQKTFEQVHRHIAANLFKRVSASGKLSCVKQVTVAKAKDRIREVECICKLIKQLVADNPTKDISRICVATLRPQFYTHIVREQFAKYGIPANITDRFELAQSPVVAAIIGLLEVSLRNLRREDILRTISTAYFDFDNNGKSLDCANLASISSELRISAGAHSWCSKIDLRIQKLQHDMLLSNDERGNGRKLGDIEHLKRAQSDIQWLQSLLHDIHVDQTPKQFQRRLQQLLDRLRLPERIVSVGVRKQGNFVEKDARAYAKLLEVVDQTANLLEYQEGTEKEHSLKFYVEQLKIALSQERYNVREQFGKGVLVTSIDETRGLPLDVMIVAGLVDGEFPSVYQSEIFFSNKRMKEREQRHTWENRYLFYQAITNWSEHLYITYPEQDADLDLVRSSFVDALKDIIDVEQWEYPGASPFEQTIYSEEDFLRQEGSAVGSGKQGTTAIPFSLEEKVQHLKRSIEVEQSRVDEHNLPEYGGDIFAAISGEAKERLQQLKHRVYSVSQLETYGKCPYQFFAHRLLRLNAVEDLEEEFSALEKGSVVHEVLFEFYTERREKKLPSLINCSEDEFAEAHRQLLRIAEKKLSEIDIPDAFWELEKELILGDKRTGRGVLRDFLEFERRRATSFQPKYFEVGFGSELGAYTRTDSTLWSEEPILAGEVLLRGKIDRVETGDDAFAIIDYKTGSHIAQMDDIRNGISLQLPLYLYTIEKLLAEKQGEQLSPAGGAYYQLRTPITMKVGVGSDRYKKEFEVVRSNANLLPPEELLSVIDESVKRVNTYVDEITRGKFPLTAPEKIDKVCTYCDYKTICRIQTVRRVEKAKPETQ